MDHIDILRRSLRLAWRSRALWVFGALLFLTGSGSFNFPRGQAQWPLDQSDLPMRPENWLPWALGLACLLFLLILIAIILRYLAEVGLYRLIDEEITLDRPATVRRGFELGWSSRTLRLFGIDLIIGIPLAFLTILVIAVALSPLFLLLFDSTAMRVLAIVLTIGLGLVGLLILIIVFAVIGVWRQLVARCAVLDDRNWIASLREGYVLFLERWQDVALIALLMWGIAIGWGILMLPVMLVLGALALALGGGPAWLIMTLTGSRLAAALVGIPIGLVVFLLPMAVLQGAYQAFHATVWTMTYRELAPAVETPGIEEPL